MSRYENDADDQNSRHKEMAVEFAERVRAKLTLLPGIGHFPHLQNPRLAIDEVGDAFR